MNFIDAACDLDPSWFWPAMAMVLVVLLAVLIIVIAWPINGAVRLERDEESLDVMARPFGDQPRLDARRWS